MNLLNYDEQEIVAQTLEKDLKKALNGLGYIELEDNDGIDSRVIAEDIKANNLSRDEIFLALLGRIHLKLSYSKAIKYKINVYPDDQWIEPNMGFYVECRFQSNRPTDEIINLIDIGYSFEDISLCLLECAKQGLSLRDALENTNDYLDLADETGSNLSDIIERSTKSKKNNDK